MRTRPGLRLAEPAQRGVLRAPAAVLEFDAEGNLLKAWGGDDPHWSGTHTLIVDKKGIIWLGTPGGFCDTRTTENSSPGSANRKLRQSTRNPK